MLPVKNFYIDSKFRTSSSLSPSNFVIDLKESFGMPEDAVFTCDDVIIPHSWYFINTNKNKLFLQLEGSTSEQPALQVYVVELSYGNYTGDALAKEIQNKIAATVEALWYIAYNVSYDTSTDKINMSSNTVAIPALPGGRKPYWKILSDREIDQQYADTSTSKKSINRVLGISGYTAKYEDGKNFTSNVINFTPVAYILIKSPNLSTFETTDSTGQRTIIKKVPVTTTRGTNIVDSSSQMIH